MPTVRVIEFNEFGDLMTDIVSTEVLELLFGSFCFLLVVERVDSFFDVDSLLLFEEDDSAKLSPT